MERFLLTLVVPLVFMASTAMAYECTKGPSAYKCYPQDPCYERFYAVLCYPQNKALGLDITITHTQKGLVLRHLRVDARQGLEKFCQ